MIQIYLRNRWFSFSSFCLCVPSYNFHIEHTFFFFLNKWVGQQHTLFIHQKFADPCHVPSPAWGPWGGSGGLFALKELTVVVRAGSRRNYNPGLGHSQIAVGYFICPAQRCKQFETPAAGPDIPSCLALLLPYQTSSCLPRAEPITDVTCLPHAHGSFPFSKFDTAISTVLCQNDGQRKKNV